MSRIRDIRLVPLEFRLPTGEGYGSSRGLTNHRGGGLVILETEDGVQGIGEAWGPPAVSRAYLEMMKPLYVGRSVFAQRGAAQDVLARDVSLRHAEPVGRADGRHRHRRPRRDGQAAEPVGRRLIGGRLREQVPVYASGGYFTEADDQAAAPGAQLEPNAARGFTAFKIKIGRHPARGPANALRTGAPDHRRRRRCSPSTPTATTPKTACWRACAAPRHSTSTGMRNRWPRRTGPATPACARARPVPLATGEALYSVFDFRRLIDGRLGIGGAARPYVMRRLRCRAHHRHAVRRRASADFAACLGHRHRPGGGGAIRRRRCRTIRTARTCRSRRWWNTTSDATRCRTSIFVEPLRYAGRHLDVPTGPGLGVTLDEAGGAAVHPA